MKLNDCEKKDINKPKQFVYCKAKIQYCKNSYGGWFVPHTVDETWGEQQTQLHKW